MDISEEEIIPLYANHLTMCRYPGETKEYDLVSNALKRLARKALKGKQATKKTASVASEQCT
jgi:hypothetical protein